jgi:hypothetical protein
MSHVDYTKYNRLWKKVRLPLPSDSRFREDLIWTIRALYYSSKALRGATGNDLKEFLTDQKEAQTMATSWKLLIQGYLMMSRGGDNRVN